jgi:hypothetical protein
VWCRLLRGHQTRRRPTTQINIRMVSSGVPRSRCTGEELEECEQQDRDGDNQDGGGEPAPSPLVPMWQGQHDVHRSPGPVVVGSANRRR